MYKFRLLPISLLTLVCLITPFASSKLLSATTTSTPAAPLSALSPQDFIKAVDDNNTQVQSGLDAALTKLLGAAQPSATHDAPATPLPADTSQPSPAAETPTTNNPPTTTTNTPATSGFNPYSN